MRRTDVRRSLLSGPSQQLRLLTHRTPMPRAKSCCASMVLPGFGHSRKGARLLAAMLGSFEPRPFPASQSPEPRANDGRPPAPPRATSTTTPHWQVWGKQHGDSGYPPSECKTLLAPASPSIHARGLALRNQPSSSSVLAVSAPGNGIYLGGGAALTARCQRPAAVPTVAGIPSPTLITWPLRPRRRDGLRPPRPGDQ